MMSNKLWGRNLLQETVILSMHPTQCVCTCVCVHISICLPVHPAISIWIFTQLTSVTPAPPPWQLGAIQCGGGTTASAGRRLFQGLQGCPFGLESSHAKERDCSPVCWLMEPKLRGW